MRLSVFRYIVLLGLVCTQFFCASISYAQNSSASGADRGAGSELSVDEATPEKLADISFKPAEYTSADNIDSFGSGVISLERAVGNATSLQQVPVNGTVINVLTLQHACELAVSNHPLVVSSYSSKVEREADYGIAKSVYYPRIDLQTQLGPSHDLDSDTTTYGEGSIGVTQTFYDFGGMQDSVASARLKAESAKLRLARTNEDISALAINAYLSILQVMELLEVYNNSLDFYQKLLDTFWERYNAGISSKADAQKVEVSLRSTQSQITMQNQQLKTTKLLLENIIKYPVTEVQSDVRLLNIEVPPTLEAAYENAREKNIALMAFAADIESQQRTLSQQDAEYYPSFGYRLQAKNQYQKDNGDKYTMDAQLTLNWNLFNGFATDERVRKEEAVLKRMVATKEASELEIQNILSDAFNAYKSSAEEFKLAKEAYDASEYLMGLYLSEFDLGIRTLLDLITAREGQTSAAVREVNARFSRVRAVLNIVLEEGRLTEVLGIPLDTSPIK